MLAFLGNRAPKWRRTPIFLLALALAPLGLLTGCGADTGGRVPVAGTVNLGGEPLERGTIELHPLEAGTVTGGTIRDGRFEIPANKGAMPGNYEVRIYASDSSGAPVEDPNAPPGESDRPLQPELIDKRYNVESELTVEIGEGGNTDLTFDLET